jgi:hypothetical protein
MYWFDRQARLVGGPSGWREGPAMRQKIEPMTKAPIGQQFARDLVDRGQTEGD